MYLVLALLALALPPGARAESLVFSAETGSFGTSTGTFDTPKGLAVASDGSVFVVDSGNKRIQKFNSNGAFVSAFGSSSNLSAPTAVAVSSQGVVYVADAGTGDRIQVFSSTGGLTATWTGLADPSAVAVAPTGEVYVADSLNSRVLRFNTSGST